MPAQQFVLNSALLLLAMAGLALLETLLPFRSSRDWRVRHLAPNLSLTLLLLALNFVLNAGAVLIALALDAHGIGLLSRLGLPPWAGLLVGIATLDGFTYLVHWLLHQRAWLWRIHRVHHSDPLVDVTTTYRQHPFEVLIRFLFTLIPALAFGLPAESIVAYRLLSASNALLEHTNVRLYQPLDTALSLLVVTPNMHKVHHSRVPRETDSNYGNILSVYDRLFRTFTPTARASEVEYGLDGFDLPELQRTGSLIGLPLRALPAPS